jgi:hypothetical protein
LEENAIEMSLGAFALFDSSSALPIQMGHSLSIKQSEAKYDAATHRLFGRAEAAEVRASALEIIAYLLNYDGRHVQMLNAAQPSITRAEVLETISPHHSVIFSRIKERGFSDRTFLNSAVAKQVAADPPTFALAMVPIPRHDKVGPKDEKGAVRAEHTRTFIATELAPRMTKLQFGSVLEMNGWVPQSFASAIEAQQQRHGVVSVQRYFQQILPLSECTAEDGQAVGKLLIDLVAGNPQDLLQAILEFVNRTAMLRECGCPHIGTMLHRILNAGAPPASGSGDEAVLRGRDPLFLTEAQAAAIGNAVSSGIHLKKVVERQTVLRTMKGKHVWFLPMLELLIEHKAARPRLSTWRTRLSSIVAAQKPAEVMSNDDKGAEDECFTSVVRLLAPSASQASSRARCAAAGASGHKFE